MLTGRSWSGGPGTGAPARVVERARIVLLAADGLTGPQIAERAGCTEPTVVKWRRQYAEAGLAGLEDAPRPGGPKTVLTDEAVCEILSATVTPPPESLQAAGVTHWSKPAAGGLAAPGEGASASAMTRSPGCGGSSACSRTAPRGSSSPPTRSWKPRSATSSACTCSPPRERGRGLRGRKVAVPGPGTGPADPADAAGHPGAADPRLRPARRHLPVRRPEHRHRPGHRRLLPPPPPPGVPATS